MKDDILRKCSLYQIRIMKMMYQRGYVMDSLMEGVDGYQVVKLTKRGELYLFLIDYKDEIDVFKVLLVEHGYDSLLIDAFLITQNLSMDIKEILVLDNFREFVDNYDMAFSENEKYTKSDGKVRGLG